MGADEEIRQHAGAPARQYPANALAASKPATDYTIDNRQTTNATSWHYINQQCVRVENFPWAPVV